MNPPPAELICFDLGRVLVRICADWHDAARQAGVHRRLDLQNPRVRQAIDDAVADLEVGAIDSARFSSRVAELGEMTPDDVDAIVAVYLRGVYDEVDDLLDELAAADLPTACLSNTNADHWRLMFDDPAPPFAPLASLRHRFASHLVGARKPDPAVYAHVEQTVGVRPERIVFFDDLPDNVQAARSRGWRAHRVDPDAPPMPQVRAALNAEGVLTA